jgi:hypothetical protein
MPPKHKASQPAIADKPHYEFFGPYDFQDTVKRCNFMTDWL